MGRTFIVQITHENIYHVPLSDEVIRLGGDPTITNAKGATVIDIAIAHNMPAATGVNGMFTKSVPYRHHDSENENGLESKPPTTRVNCISKIIGRLATNSATGC